MKKPESLGYQPLPGRDRSPLERPLQRRGVSPLLAEPARSGELRGRPAVARQKASAAAKPVAPGQPGAPGRDRERFISLPDELQGDEDLEQHQTTGVRGRITVYCIAEALDRRGLEARLRAAGGGALLHTYPDVVYGLYVPGGAGHPAASAPVATPNGGPYPYVPDGGGGGLLAPPGAAGAGEVFYFDYGVVAFWGLSPQQEREVLRGVQKFLVDKLPQSEAEMDEFQFVVTAGEKPHIQNDTITISQRLGQDHLIKMSILHALAQSTKLSVYEGRAMELVESTKDLPELLATSGRVVISRKRVAQLIGQVFIQKSAVNLLSTVLDTPEFFWSAPDAMQSLYKRVCEYVEYDSRVENNAHGARLEWVVIWLILVEIILGVFECASILGWDYVLSPFQRRGGKEVLPESLDHVRRNLITDAVIGSLPAALSVEQRLAISASTPMSAKRVLLNSLPGHQLRSKEGRLLRRDVLNGAVLVWITAGYSGKRFVFERAKELGVLVDEGIAERFISLDMSDATTVLERCLEAIEGVRQELGGLDGVLSFCEMAQPLAARVAERLGLPGAPPAAVDAARDKHATRVALEAAGLEAAGHVGFPAVLKPICGAASIGVVRVESLEQLQEAFDRVCQDMRAAKVVAGALQQGDDEEESEEGSSSGGEGNANAWITTTLMLEEYLDGPEVDVDLVFSEGRPVYGAVRCSWDAQTCAEEAGACHRQLADLEPYFNETGSNTPSALPLAQQRELAELAVRSVLALGFASGVFHVELKYTSAHGARLIEVNCRMGGGSVRNQNLLVWGVDLVEEALLAAAGIPSRPPVAPRPLCNIAEFSVNAQRTGVLRGTSFLEPFQTEPGMLYCRAMVEPGTKVVCKDDGLPTWVCEFMLCKPTIEEAIESAVELEARLQAAMPIDPLGGTRH
eukprot:scaffold1.g5398.t1